MSSLDVVPCSQFESAAGFSFSCLLIQRRYFSGYCRSGRVRLAYSWRNLGRLFLSIRVDLGAFRSIWCLLVNSGGGRLPPSIANVWRAMVRGSGSEPVPVPEPTRFPNPGPSIPRPLDPRRSIPVPEPAALAIRLPRNLRGANFPGPWRMVRDPWALRVQTVDSANENNDLGAAWGDRPP